MAKPLLENLRLLQGGALLDTAGERLAELIQAVEDTGKAGKFQLTLDIKKNGAALAIKADVIAKIPEPKVDPDLLWSTPDGNLTPANPKQQSLELREVGGVDKTTLRDVYSPAAATR
jgi:hypothetical protein